MKLIYTLIFVIITSTVVNAQQYQLSFHAGHQFGFRSQLSNDVNLSNRIKYSLGNGVSSCLMIGIVPDSANWYVSLGLNSLRGNTVLVSENFVNKTNYDATSKYIISHRLAFLLNYRFNIKRNFIQLNSGIVLPVYNRIVEEYAMKDSVMFLNKSYNVRNYFAVGYQGGIELSKKINNTLSLCFSAHLTVLNQKVKSKVLNHYLDSEFNGIEYITDRADREFYYKKEITDILNNETFLPRSFNKNLPTDLLTYTETLSSFGISLGVKYHF